MTAIPKLEPLCPWGHVPRGVRSLFLIFFISRYSFDLTSTKFKHIKLEYTAVIFDIAFVVDIVCPPRVKCISQGKPMRYVVCLKSFSPYIKNDRAGYNYSL